jgi:hypothetical protein
LPDSTGRYGVHETGGQGCGPARATFLAVNPPSNAATRTLRNRFQNIMVVWR